MPEEDNNPKITEDNQNNTQHLSKPGGVEPIATKINPEVIDDTIQHEQSDVKEIEPDKPSVEHQKIEHDNLKETHLHNTAGIESTLAGVSIKAATDEIKEIENKKPKKKHKLILSLASVLAAIVIVFAPNLIMRLISFDKIMPKTTVSAVQVGGKNSKQFQDLLQQSYNSKKVEFSYNSQTKEASYADIGLKYDYEATFNKARSAHRNNIADLIFFWRNVEIEPEYSIDSAKLDSFLISEYGQSNPPKNAEIVFSEDQSKFVINPEQSGKGIDSVKAAKDISGISRATDKPGIELVESEVKPSLTTKDLEKLNSEANQYVENPITISWLGTTQTISGSQKKDWLKLKDDQDKYLSAPELKNDDAKNYITDLINSVKRDQAAKEIISAEGFQVVITEGADGREVANPERYITQFTDALSTKQPLNLNVDVKTIPRQVKDYSSNGGRWIYVNLASFKMVAYEGSNPVRTFAISSGASSFPTVTGNFKVYAKIRSQTMKGGSGTAEDPIYSVPNVEWVSYFTGNYGIHGVYWHSDFGVRNRSHGCVGITNADAEWIYNWDSIGTPVIVR
jgi:lipoprotein-anchoring transpeptidase ErfK/SrfK